MASIIPLIKRNEKAVDCFLKVKKHYLKFLNKEKIFDQSVATKIANLRRIYIPVSFWIDNKYKKKGKTLFLGLSGGQGSGKTTVVGILKIILKKYFKRKTHVTSIDDFYKTLEERNKISSTIHPLFKTRGVPGTHDTNLIKKFFDFIKKKRFKKFKLPKFDKSIDDRLKKKYCFNIKEKPEVVILEGWCVGAKPQSNSLLKKPINILEKYEDKDLIWRKHANHKLKKEYKKLFAMIDYFIFMKIPYFNMVFKWRLLQERKLKKMSHIKKRIMSYNKIKRFIMFYQRITLQMLKDMPKIASVVLSLNDKHQINKIRFKN
jgi:D-glycerate 3-kinase